jgi:hypothetical protein
VAAAVVEGVVDGEEAEVVVEDPTLTPAEDPQRAVESTLQVQHQLSTGPILWIISYQK